MVWYQHVFDYNWLPGPLRDPGLAGAYRFRLYCCSESVKLSLLFLVTDPERSGPENWLVRLKRRGGDCVEETGGGGMVARESRVNSLVDVKTGLVIDGIDGREEDLSTSCWTWRLTSALASERFNCCRNLWTASSNPLLWLSRCSKPSTTNLIWRSKN